MIGSVGTKNVMFIFGTRPEAIKLAPVIQQVETCPDLTPVIAVTGQHREMLAQILTLFSLEPDHDLAVMKPNQDLFDVTAAVLLGLRDVLRADRPDAVVVQGDTTSCFVGALAAFYENIPVAHVEAGLRTGTMRAPFPEEANRTLTGRLAHWHFPPTKQAQANLLAEGIAGDQVEITGNTVIDALLWVRDRIVDLKPEAFPALEPIRGMLEKDASIVLVTGHRRENFGAGFESLCAAIADVAAAHPDWHMVYPVHLNPNVRGPVFRLLGDRTNVHLIDPLSYQPFIYLMNRSRIVLTDSGGVQEEAPSLGKPVLVTRDVTERPEAVEAGTVRLVGTDRNRIVTEMERLITDSDHYAAMSRAHNPYGDGHAARRIVDRLRRDLCGSHTETRPKR